MDEFLRTVKWIKYRRDFTINGLFYDPITDKLLDFVGGQKDLEVRTLRAIGNAQERFAEDHLRLLRAVRFATRFEFEIAEETWEALEAFAPDISRISPERIRDELDRIWVHPNRVLGFDLLVKSGLMLAIFPEILKLQGCEQPPQWHPEGDVFVPTRIMLDMLPDLFLEVLVEFVLPKRRQIGPTWLPNRSKFQQLLVQNRSWAVLGATLEKKSKIIRKKMRLLGGQVGGSWGPRWRH